MTPQPTLSERLYNEMATSFFALTFPHIPVPGDDKDPLTITHIEQVANRIIEIADAQGLNGTRELASIFGAVASDHFEHVSESTGQPKDKKR